MSSANLVVFPLFGINDGVCACWLGAACKRVGKHASCTWGDVTLNSPAPHAPAPGAGYGVRTGAAPEGSGVIVVDLDSDAAADAWEAMGGDFATYTVTTPRGFHLYFKHPGFPVGNSAGQLAKGIDIRGDGGFVVGPGSPHKSGETYEVGRDNDVVDAPTFLLQWLKSRPQQKEIAHYPGDIEVGTPEHAYRRRLYTEYLTNEAEPCVQGEGGDPVLFRVVQRGAYDYALPTADVLELITEHYDPRCNPPWGDELEARVLHKAHDAKTKSAREAMTPLPEDLAHLAKPVLHRDVVTDIQEGFTSAQTGRLSPAERALRLSSAGVRLTTGLPGIDTATRGGLMLRKLVAIGGAPGAGKTALAIQLAYRWLTEGIHVGVLAADEDANALLIRFGQLAGLNRELLENGDTVERERLAAWCNSVPLILADGDEQETIIRVSNDLKEAAKGQPSVLIADSIQTVRPGPPLAIGVDIRTKVNVVVSTLKAAARIGEHLVITTSELSKAAYRNKSQADNISALSAFKESGDIEYGVGLAIVLTKRQGVDGVVDGIVAKNRMGQGQPEFVLRLDAITSTVSEIDKETAGLLGDPLYFVKQEIRDILEAAGGSPMSRNAIYGRIGGRKQAVFDAIKKLLVDLTLFEDARGGVRFPLPGDAGYKA